MKFIQNVQTKIPNAEITTKDRSNKIICKTENIVTNYRTNHINSRELPVYSFTKWKTELSHYWNANQNRMAQTFKDLNNMDIKPYYIYQMNV